MLKCNLCKHREELNFHPISRFHYILVSAKVASFGESLVIRQGQSVQIDCLAVGQPSPSLQWIFR